MLDLYQRALEFDTSRKRGFTYCSKKKEVSKVLKKKKKEVLRKNWGTKGKGLVMRVRRLYSDWANLKYRLENFLATSP